VTEDWAEVVHGPSAGAVSRGARHARWPLCHPSPHACGRVHVDHLNLATQPFILKETVHDHQAVAQDQAVHPVGLILISLEQPVGNIQLLVGEEGERLLSVALV